MKHTLIPRGSSTLFRILGANLGEKGSAISTTLSSDDRGVCHTRPRIPTHGQYFVLTESLLTAVRLFDSHKSRKRPAIVIEGRLVDYTCCSTLAWHSILIVALPNPTTLASQLLLLDVHPLTLNKICSFVSGIAMVAISISFGASPGRNDIS